MRGLFSFFKRPSVVLATLFFWAILFGVYAYFLNALPGTDPSGLACMEGGNLTPINLTYGVVLSLLVSMFLCGSVFSYKRKTKGKLLSGSTFSLSAALAFLSAFCTLCVFPSLTFLGLGIGLSVFTQYSAVLKVLSLVLLLVSLHLLDRRLRIACDC